MVVGFVIPVWWSAFGLLIAGGLALMVWREAHTREEA
jgi:HAMP domain-containing protein